MGARTVRWAIQVAALAGCLAAALGCSDSDKKAGLSLAGGGGSSGADVQGDGSAAAGDGTAAGDGATAAELGYLPLHAALSGHWMRRDLGNCVDLETWLSFLLPDGFVHTEVDRNACGAHQVRKTAGELKILPHQLLQYTWHAKQPGTQQQWQQRKVTAALVEDLPGANQITAEPTYKPGKRALTVLAFVRAQGGQPFKRLDSWERVTDGPKPTHTVQIAAVQVQVTPPPEAAKPGDACSMVAQLSVSWDPGPTEPGSQATEQFTLPCHYAKDAATGWLRVAADGFEQNGGNDAWSKLFETKGIWKKYSSFVGQQLFDAFRPVLQLPPGQPNLLLSLASHGWYREFLNDPPISVP